MEETKLIKIKYQKNTQKEHKYTHKIDRNNKTKDFVRALTSKWKGKTIYLLLITIDYIYKKIINEIAVFKMGNVWPYKNILPHSCVWVLFVVVFCCWKFKHLHVEVLEWFFLQWTESKTTTATPWISTTHPTLGTCHNNIAKSLSTQISLLSIFLFNYPSPHWRLLF